MKLRVGTRGSDLALWQTNWVCERLKAAHPGLEIEQIVIKTHGDMVTDRNFGREWPVGAFVSALENALLEKRVDFAVHSFKDLQTAETEGLTIAATPEREVVHDVLLLREPWPLDALPAKARIGTNSPRRAAQMAQFGDIEIIPIRGNVPTRIEKIKKEDLHGTILAAAGLKRLGIEYPHRIELPVERFVPAPAQGALAIQTRRDDPAYDVCAVMNDVATRKAVVAERTILARINAGCHTPVAALARVADGQVELHGRLYSDDYSAMAERRESSDNPAALGASVADALLADLGKK